MILSSDNDADRQTFEACKLKGKRVVNPIVDWLDEDIWDYCGVERLSMNPLYSCGFSRVGCIGCPMAGKRGREFGFATFPTFRVSYIRAFDRMLEERKRRGKPSFNGWDTGVDVFHRWMEDGVLPGQAWLPGFGELEA